MDLILQVDPNLPDDLIGDPGRIRQVASNLVSNAIKFTKDGQVIIRIMQAAPMDTRAHLRVEIIDTGIGLTPEQQQRLFQKFSQADSSTTRVYGGTGLGLAISKQLVELMGGTIGVSSVPGHGSTFWFNLDLPLAGTTDTAQLGATSTHAGKTILFAADHPTTRQVLGDELRLLGFKTVEAAAGFDALNAIQSAADNGTPIDAAILSINLSGLDGVTLGTALQDEAKLRQTRLIILGPSSRQSEQSTFAAAGFLGYLCSPIRRKDVRNIVEAVLAPPPRPLEFITRHGLVAAIEDDGQNNPHQHPFLNCRILVVDDNTVNQKVASVMLQRYGCMVDVAANGMEACNMVNMLPYDLVLMDCQMPEMDGYQASQAIRKREGELNATRRLPIIALTANAMEGNAEKCLSAGMDDYLSKPIRPEALYDKLLQHLSRADKPTATVSPNATPKACTDGFKEMHDILGDSYAELAQLYLTEAPIKVKQLTEALAQGKLDTTHSIAHHLKGSSLSLGATALAELLAVLEAASQAGDLATLSAHGHRLVSTYAQTERAMTHFLQDEISTTVR